MIYRVSIEWETEDKPRLDVLAGAISASPALQVCSHIKGDFKIRYEQSRESRTQSSEER